MLLRVLKTYVPYTTDVERHLPASLMHRTRHSFVYVYLAIGHAGTHNIYPKWKAATKSLQCIENFGRRQQIMNLSIALFKRPSS